MENEYGVHANRFMKRKDRSAIYRVVDLNLSLIDDGHDSLIQYSLTLSLSVSV